MSLNFEPVAAGDFESMAQLRIAALRPSLERLGRFDPSRARILAVNNGCLDGEGMLGVLHHAHVGAATAGAGRPISSVLLGVEAGGLDDAALAAFVRDGTAASA